MKKLFIYIIVTICIVSIGYCFFNMHTATAVNNTEIWDSIPTYRTTTDTATFFTRDCVSHDIKYSIKYNVGMTDGVCCNNNPQSYNEDYIKCCIKSSFRIVGNKYFEEDLQNNFEAFVTDILSDIQNSVHDIVEFKIINE